MFRRTVALVGLALAAMATPAGADVTVDEFQGGMSVFASTRLPGQAAETVQASAGPGVGSGPFSFSHSLGGQEKTTTLECPGHGDAVLQAHGHPSSISGSATDGDGISLSYSGTAGGDASMSLPGPPCTQDDFRASGGASNLLTVRFTLTEPLQYSWSSSVSGEGLQSGDPRVFLAGPGVSFRDTGTSQGILQQGSYTFQANAGAAVVLVGPGGDSSSANVQVSLEVGGDPPPPPPPVAVTGSPSGTVGERTAVFEFAALGDELPPGRLECRVDGQGDAPFTPCSSPLTVGPLPDGEHVFQVRYKPDGEDAGPATERRWTIDSTPPAVRITSAPSGPSNLPDATIEFGGEGIVSFVCSLDGTDAFDCSSPHRLVGLTPGTHRFSVVGIDAAGNTSDAAVAEWGVAALNAPAAPATCAAPAQTRVSFGVVFAVARAPGACFQPIQINGQPAHVSTGFVTVNGIEIHPRNGARIELVERVGGGTLRTIGPVTLKLGNQEFPIDSSFTFDGLAQGGVALVKKTLSVASGLPAMAQLPIQPSLDFDLTAANGGSATVKATVKLPELFAAVPGRVRVQGLSFEVGFATSNNLGGSWSVKGGVAEIWLAGRVLLKDLLIGYDDAEGVFSGQVGVNLTSGRFVRQNLPRLGPGATLTTAIELGPNGIFGPIRKLTLQASALNKHIGDGIFLQRLGAGLVREGQFVKWKGNGGISLGPSIDLGALFRGEAVAADGEIVVAFPTAENADGPYSLEIKGTGKVIEFQVIQQTLKYSFPPRFDWTAMLDFSVAGYGISADLRQFWFDAAADDFNIEADGQARLPGIVSLVDGRVDVVVSKTGMAACFNDADGGLGFGKRWGEDVDIFVDTCNVGPFRRGPAAAGAGGGQSFTVERGTRFKVIAAEGSGTPPKVDLSGPGGVTITTPDGPEGIDSRGALLVQDPKTNTTSIALINPAAGRWTVTPRPGSTVTRVRIADELPPVHVRARVAGRGARRTLSWDAGRLPGHRLTFVERAPGGAAQVIADGSRTRGRRGFTPLPVRGRHTIEVTVARKGVPRERLAVTRFSAAPPRLARVAGVVRRRTALSWKRQAAASEYAVAVEQNGAVVLNETTRRVRLRVPAGRITVTIVPIAADGRPGPALRKTFKR